MSSPTPSASPNSRQKRPALRALSAPHPGVAVQQFADSQYGVISRSQLLDLGVSGSAISRWVRGGRLHLFAYWCIPLGIAVTAWKLISP